MIPTYFVLVLMACGINGFGNCIDSGVAIRDVAKFTSLADCVKAGNQLVRKDRPLYVRADCIEVR
jgi:hypothetical protein